MITLYRNFLSLEECDSLKNLALSNTDKWKEYPDFKDVPSTSAIKVYGNSYFRHLISTNFNLNAALKLYNSTEDISSDYYKEFLIQKLSLVFDGIKYIKGFSIPGFQIVEQETPRVWHYDDEKLRYPYKLAFPDYNNTKYFDRWVTFTIMLSEGDFTYDYYTETKSEYKDQPEYYCRKHHGLRNDECNCNLKEYSTIKYSLGDMILADGRYLHRVGKSSYFNDSRITIQGHIVTKGSASYMYW